jgi:RNA 2',3'-cyclic 3'-phosphodiesterase
VRTFIALNLPAAERVLLYDALAPLRETSLPVRWLVATSLHVTIKFLGDTDAAAVPDIDRALHEAAARRAPIDLRIGGLGGFPSLRRASIVWIGVAPDPALMALYRDLEPALSRLGYPRETRPFRPHITVGRVSGSAARMPDLERLGGLVTFTATIPVATVDLMQSHPGAKGSRYETLLSRTLGDRVTS